MSTPKLSTEYRVRWRRSTWQPDEHAHIVVVGDELAAHGAAAHIAAMYDDVTEVVLEIRQVTRWRHHDIVVLDETPARARGGAFAPPEQPASPPTATPPCEDVDMQSGLERLLIRDAENGVDMRNYDVVWTGQPKPKRDRTIPAAPLGWTPPDEQDAPA